MGPQRSMSQTLYQVLFDATALGVFEIYDTFRRSFVSGYVGASGHSLPEEMLNRFIDLRVEALRIWLDDLDSAPIGIRTASRDWHATLRSFVATYRPATH